MTDRRDEMALLVAAVDQGSLSGAGRMMGLSPASVGRHLSMLEERLGVRLIVRSTRQLRLTDAGRTYYASAKRLLAEIDDMEATLSQQAAEPAGRLHVTAPTLFGRVHLLPVLARFLAKYPRVEMDVSLLDRPVNLLDEGVDIALVVGDQPDSSLVSRHLGSIRWVLAASPDYLARRGEPASIDALTEHDGLVFSHHGSASIWSLNNQGHGVKVHPQVRMRANTLDGVVAAAVEGVGIVHAPAWAIADHAEAGRLKVLLPQAERAPRPVYALMTHQRLLANRVRILVDYLADAIAGSKLHL